jgi:hypothetical protein
MQLNNVEAATPVAMAAIQSQGNNTLPEATKSEDFFRDTWHDCTEIIERFNKSVRFTPFIGYKWTPNEGPGNNMHRDVIYRSGKADADQMPRCTTSSGFTAVWATENTRESIWDAIIRLEIYATTGLRMTVWFFGGWEFTQDDVGVREPGWIGYNKGVPMGSDLPAGPDGASPATYYVRVLQIPTPRWTDYEAQRFQIDLPEDVQMTTQERAYTSPIWYTAAD